MAHNKPINPFYVLLLIVSIVFVVTVCGYTLLTFRTTSLVTGNTPETSGLMVFLDEHGMMLIIVEVALLGLATVGAIMTDDYWMKRARREAGHAEQQVGNGKRVSIPANHHP